ncbi:V-set and immunoglobulin domain-containing protein 10-like isoform X1 [Python bivittatus]|uniref:V-set and immunoglobulin domain-containing protein 10-like isoform X1 n=1 Tax=Python bivittatus TaxID=176946 RepID=UPI000D6A0C33|nr:V-set and immunoglobulin domain-containing protein 10-like isoform X1 [Python bivittatus]XP_025028053.1 V-set and immunoglobulin domain-containing protein 10-like isoform X1 [Python bivittatus]
MAYWHPGVRCPSSLAICLLLLLVPLFPVLSSSPLAVLVGDSISLPIPFSLPSAPSQIAIIWRRNATILAIGNLRPNFTVVVDSSFRSQFSVDPRQGNLNISALRTMDSGIYSVEIFPLGSFAQKGNITIIVYEEVGNISVIPSSAEVIERNSSVAFNCTPVRGFVSWTKDGHSLDDNPRYLHSSGYLQIRNPLRTDAGVYSCTISNPFGNATGTANLTVYYGPETPTIAVSSSERDSDAGSFVLVNSTVSLTCLAPSNPPAKIYWNVADDKDRYVPSSPVLQLRRVQLNQGGLYSCLAINQQTRLQFRNTRRITVAQCPSGSPRCSLTSVHNGSALLFACSWTGGSPAPNLTFQGLPGRKEEVSASNLQSLLVSPFPAGISGTKVTCLGHHLTGQDNCTLIPEAPSGVTLSFQAFSDSKGLVTLQLHCQGTFNPLEIKWFGDKQSVISVGGGRYQLSPDRMHLTIWNFTAPQDLGDYSTICSNPLGSQRSNLTIIGSPPLLAGPSISDSTLSSGPHSGTAYLAWTVPNGSAVTSFWIQMRGPKHRSAEEWNTVEVLGATNRSASIIGLQPQTTYAFQIVPYLGSQAGNATQIHTLHPDASLTDGAIAGIVIGCIFGMLLILALLFLVIWLICLRRENKKVPPTPPENQQYYLSRQFPNGRKVEPSDSSWDNSRWSGDSDIYAITYEEHLHRHLSPTTLPIGIREGTSSYPAVQPGTRNVRSATQV